MKTNARKIISFVLSFLMVFGSIATLLPTTVMAANVSVTFQNEKGVAIATVTGSANTIKGLLNSGTAEANTVKAAIAQNDTDAKVFAGWTKDGTAIGDTDTISGNITVTATFSNYKLYTAADIRSLNGLENYKFGSSKMALVDDSEDDAFKASVVLDSGNNYFVQLNFKDSLAAYKEVLINHKTNTIVYSDKNTYQSYINDADYYYVDLDAPASNSGAAASERTIRATYYPASLGKRINFYPWGNQNIRASGGICLAPSAITDSYFDIQYIAFFDKAGAAKYFKYGDEAEEPEEPEVPEEPAEYAVTFSDGKEGTDDVVFEGITGNTTIDKLLASDSDKQQSIYEMIAQTDKSVFAGWVSGGTAYSGTTAITGELTLTANFSGYQLFTAADLLNPNKITSLTTINMTDMTDAEVTTTTDGKSFLHFLAETKSSGHIINLTFANSLVNYSTLAVKYVTNAYPGISSTSTSTRRGPRVFYNGADTGQVDFPYTGSNITEVSDISLVDENAKDEVFATFKIPADTTLNTVDFRPWNGLAFASNFVWPSAFASNLSSAYVDIEYIVAFENAGAADNWNKYAKNEVTFSDGTKDIAKISFVGKTTLGKLLEKNPVQKGLVDAYIAKAQNKLQVFAGWVSGKTSYTSTTEITGNLTLTPVLSKYVVYTAQDLLDAKKGGSLTPHQSRLTIADVVSTTDDNEEFLRFQKVADKTSTHCFDFVLPSKIENYQLVGISYKTNATYNILTGASGNSRFRWFDAAGTQNGYKDYAYTSTIQPGNGAKDTVFATFAADDIDAEKIRFEPWRNQEFRADATANGVIYSGTDTTNYADAYVDVEYIVFFENADAKDYFSYSKYLDEANVKSVTFYDEEGEILADITFDETAALEDIIKSNNDAKAKIEAYTAQTATKVFTGWTAGDVKYGNDYEISDSVKLTPTFSEYKIYTAEDLLTAKSDGSLTTYQNRLIIADKVNETNGYLNFKSSGVKNNHSFTFNLPSELQNYKMMAVSYETNAYTPRINQTVMTHFDGTAAYYPYTETNIKINGDGKATDKVLATFDIPATVTTVTSVKFAPWRNQTFGAEDPDAPNDTVYPFGKEADAYVDVEYIVFFENADAKDNFDYNKYIAARKEVTFKNESGETIATVPFTSEKTTINTLLADNAVGVATLKKALQTETQVLAGWTKADGTSFTADTEITESITVKANLSGFKVYTAKDLLLSEIALNDSMSKNKDLIVDEDNGKTYFQIKPTRATGNYITLTLDSPLSNYAGIAIGHKTNARTIDNAVSSFVRYNGSDTQVPYTNPKPYGITKDDSNVVSGFESLKATYPINVTEDITTIDFAPWNAKALTNTGLTLAPDNTYSGVYANIEYIAFFEEAGAADNFDFDVYMGIKKSVTFKVGDLEETIEYTGRTSIEDLLALDITAAKQVSKAIAQTDTRVLASWTSDDGKIIAGTDRFDTTLTVTAAFSEFKVYTAEELLKAANVGDLTPTNMSVADEVDENALRFSATTANGHKITLDFESPIVNYSTLAVKYVTNAYAGGARFGSRLVYNATPSVKDDFPYKSKITEDISDIDKVNEDAKDEVFATFEIPKDTTLNTVEFQPWHSLAFASNRIWPSAFANSPSSAYVDIEYIVAFEKEGAANYFEYDEYLETTKYAYFKNRDDEIVADSTLKIVNGEITLPVFDTKDLADGEVFKGWKIEGTENSTYVVQDTTVEITRPTVFVPVIGKKVSLTITYTKKEGTTDSASVEACTGLPLPLDNITLQYKDKAAGKYMVVSGVKVGENDPVSIDEYVVKGDEKAVTLVYAPAYILSEEDNTLDGASDNAKTINRPDSLKEDSLKEEEGTTYYTYYQHYTTVGDAQTESGTKIKFVNTNENVLYDDVPYVSFSYRTNVERNQWWSAFSAQDFNANSVYAQQVKRIEPDEEWHRAVQKPTAFSTSGAFPNAITIAPWSTKAGISLNGDEYVDIQYVGFFPSETAAKYFDYSKYFTDNKVTVTVTIDGKKALSGDYLPGTTIALPDDITTTPGLAGYLLTDGSNALENGMVSMTVNVPANGVINATSRIVNTKEYIQYHGNLNNLKEAGKNDEITVVYIGGSVTDGRGASSARYTSWTALTTQYLKTKYATVNEYNEGLGGQGSRSAAYRLTGDVISHNPDLVFIEFAINDHYNGEIVGEKYDGKYYEYVIREIRKALPYTEIVAVYTGDLDVLTNDDGTLIGTELPPAEAQEKIVKHPTAAAQEEIVKHYDIPSIDVGKYAFEAIFTKDGTCTNIEDPTWFKYYGTTDPITGGPIYDKVHPGDAGYALYARAVKEYLENALAGASSDNKKETFPADVKYPDCLTFRPVILDWNKVTIDGMKFIDTPMSTTFNKFLQADTDYTCESGDHGNDGHICERTISFSFVGTELNIYMLVPGTTANTETNQGFDDTLARAKVTIDGTVYTNPNVEYSPDLNDQKQSYYTPDRDGPYMYGSGLENKEHEVTITLTNVSDDSCRIYGIFVGQEPTTTIDLSASIGGKVSYNGIEGDQRILAYPGETLIFKAVAEDGYKLRDWYNIISGQNEDLTGDATPVPYEGVYTFEYPVTVADAHVNANFVPNAWHANVRLVAFVRNSTEGYFTVEGVEGYYTYFDDYVTLDKDVKLTAYGMGDHVPVYWRRMTQDSMTNVLVDTGSEITVPALGGSVFYQPVFAKEKVAVYIDKATREILSTDTEPSDYTCVEDNKLSTEAVKVYNCTSKQETDTSMNGLTVYGLDGKELTHETKPQFASEWIIRTTEDDTDTMWTLKYRRYGEENYSKPVVVSYDKEFSFHYMFPSGTEVVITEVPVQEGQKQTASVNTLMSWTAGDITTFAANFVLPEKCTLVKHGVLMSQNPDLLGSARYDEENGEIVGLDESVIVGHSRDNTENPTALFTIAKRHAPDADTWYGRAFLVYKENDSAPATIVLGEIIPTPTPTV